MYFDDPKKMNGYHKGDHNSPSLRIADLHDTSDMEIEHLCT